MSGDKLHFRIDKADTHVHFTVFINGANAGKLCMNEGEFGRLCAALVESHEAYYTTPHGGPEIIPPTEEEIAHQEIMERITGSVA